MWTSRVFFFFVTLVTGPRRSLSLKLSDTRVYEPEIRTRLGKTPPRVDLTKLPCRCFNLAFDLTVAS